MTTPAQGGKDLGGSGSGGEIGGATVDATRLRLIAEAADGLRGTRLALEEAATEGSKTLMLVDESRPSAGPRVAKVFTPKLDRTKPIVRLGHRKDEGARRDDDPDVSDKFDAVFWSDSAVRKFVQLYYASIWDITDVAAFLWVWENTTTMSYIAHIPPSRPELDGADQPMPGIVVYLENGRVVSGKELRDFVLTKYLTAMVEMARLNGLLE